MEAAEQRILEAAIACIQEDGLSRLTVRKIAAKANVNIAAINYYFRSKEHLLSEVTDLTLRNAFDWDDLEFTQALPPREQVLAIMEHLAAGAQQFSRITQAHFHEAMVNGNYETKAVAALNRFMDVLFEKLRARGYRMNEKDLRLSMAQVFMAGVFCLGVAPNLCRGFLGADLTQEKERSAYLRHLVDRLID